MNTLISGVSLIAAASLFWLAWLLMPGVGVTDAGLIFELVGSHRSSVLASVVLQLISAALYVPALIGIASTPEFKANLRVKWGAGILLLGAMGSAADAVYHVLAFAMTAPGMDRGALLPVMAYMQGPGLLFVAPFILSFFAGGAILSSALERIGRIHKGSTFAHWAALGCALLGGAAASRGMIPPRLVGLMTLAAVSCAQAVIGGGLGVAKRV